MAQMKNKRMFSLGVIDTDLFMEMPISSRLLYYELGMRADDDGFVDNWKKILACAGLKEDDLKVLIAKKYIIPFDSGVIVIRHWRLNNYLRSDRYEETKYLNEKSNLELNQNQEYSLKDDVGIPSVYQVSTNRLPRLDKNSIDKNNKEEKYIKEESKDNSDTKSTYEEMFEEFWSRYPKKKVKSKAREWYMKHRPSKELHEEILMSLLFFAEDEEWKKDNGKYIPHPTTFLNQRRWEDYRND